jgi:hypothetical protein
MLTTLCVLAAALAAPPSADLPYEQPLRDLAAANPGLVEIARIGSSRQGRPIIAAWLTDRAAADPAPADRPTLVIVAGLNPMHRVGIDAAVGLAARLVEEQKEALKTTSICIVPCANPDTFAWHLDANHPRTDWGRTIVPHDVDHDGRVNEDPAEDLNGDGLITMMRVKNPSPGTGLRAEWAVDPENPKALKKPDAAKGERAEYALLVEGIDNDGDGKFNEDGIGGSGGGIDLDLNFPYRWPEFQDGAGKYPLSEPESRALVDWMLSLKNVAAVLVYGPGDTLVNIPQTGRMDPTGQVPLGIEEGDKPPYDEVSKIFKDATGMTGAAALDNAGSFEGWAYAQYGVLAFETPVWVRPDLVKKEEKKDGDKKEGEKPEQKAETPAEPAREQPERPRPPPGAAPQPAGGPPPGAPGGTGRPGGGRRGQGRPPGAEGGPPAESGKKPEPAGDDGKWLKYDEDRVKAGDAPGFVNWQPFHHPQLGDVEIGGWTPGFKLNPPASELPRLVGEQTKFVGALLAKFPKVTAEGPWVERVGPALWRVSIRLTNDGYLPTMPAIGAKARRSLPTLITLDAALERIVSGDKHTRAWAIPGSGGKAEATWLVNGAEGDTIKIDLHPSIGARRSVEVKLREASR